MKLEVLVAGLILASLLTGCKPENSKMSDYKGNAMYFKIISDEDYGAIVYDTRTGVEYWYSTGAYNYGTLTVLVDKNGKPLIHEVNE